MRVNELSKELGKTNKEVLEILQKNHFDIASHASNITDDQTDMVRRALSAGQPERKNGMPGAEISKSGNGKAETIRVEEMKKEPIKAEATQAVQQTQAPQQTQVSQPMQASHQAQVSQPTGGKTEKAPEAPKKRIAAVYRPQNSTQRGNNTRPNQGPRPSGQGYANQGARPMQQNLAPSPARAVSPAAPLQAQTPQSVQPVQPSAVQQPSAAPQAAGQAFAAPQSAMGQTSAAPQPATTQASAVPQPAAGQTSAAPQPTAGLTSAAPQPAAQPSAAPHPATAPAGGQGGYQGNRDGQRTGYQGNRDGQRPGYQGQNPNYQGNREGQRPGYQGQNPNYQGNREGQRPGYQGQNPNYQGNREGQRPGYQGQNPNYQGNREGQRPGYQGQNPNYQGNREGQRPGYQGQTPGGYQGNRPGYQGQGQTPGGYQGNRPGYQGQGQTPGGYQGNRPGYQGQGQTPGGYQGNRPGYQGQGQTPGGYQGQRPGYQGQTPGGYQGNRPGYQGQTPGGYQGQRPGGYQGQASGGYQGQRPGGYQGQNTGGYQGGRDGQRGPAGRAPGAKPSFDTPVAQKPQNNKQNRNSYKNDKYDKKTEDARPKVDKNGKLIKVPVLPPRQREEAKVPEIKTIILPEFLTIKELAEKMKLQPSAIVKKLFLQGKVVTINQEVDYDQAEEIAMEFNVLCEKEIKIDVIEELLKEEDEDTTDMVARPPVVCVMGHVDHGKTSLLDAIRQTNVTAKEAGGITQHIGAYTVDIKGQQITFLDTPGHEAFTAMRMRGAKSTDIAILVVAADDGVMPQTIEAINHAKAAGVEIIVAINKVDKPSANVEKVKQELIEYELVSEDWGGTTIFVPVSAHTKAGIPELLEMILLAAEVKELRANPDRTARGLVIEAELDKGKGPVATVLVQKGTLRVGDPIAAGSCFGKVRAMMDDKGRRVKEAGPSMPVEILGLNDVPNAGDVFVATENDKEARSFAETFISEGRTRLIEDTKAKLSLDDLFTQIKAGNVKELPIVVKADVQGSVEAVKQSLVKISNDEVIVKVIHGGVGAINESDVSLAAASNAIIIGFNVRPDVTAKSIADREKVDMRLYRVIYQAIEDVEAAMKGMLDPIFEERIIGHAAVRQTFKASGVGTIAGSYVLDGKFQRGCKTRVTRAGEMIYDGPLVSLKRFKDDVKEVAAGFECGLVFEKFNEIQEDDMIEAYAMVEIPR